MKIFIILTVTICFFTLGFSQEQASEKKKEKSAVGKMEYKGNKADTKSYDKTINIEKSPKGEIKKSDEQVEGKRDVNSGIEVTVDAAKKSPQSKEKLRMGAAESSGPPVELKKMDVKTNTTEEDLQKALGNPTADQKKKAEKRD